MRGYFELSEVERAAIWERFYAEFHFKPDYYERSAPAISEPAPFVTFDLSTPLGDETRAEIDAALLSALRAITPPGRTLYSLDWHHTCYRFDPHLHEAVASLRWYPDGDYYIFLAEDLSFGTFGHPWQESLCVFGANLLSHVERLLRAKLAVLRASPAVS